MRLVLARAVTPSQSYSGSRVVQSVNQAIHLSLDSTSIRRNKIYNSAVKLPNRCCARST